MRFRLKPIVHTAGRVVGWLFAVALLVLVIGLAVLQTGLAKDRIAQLLSDTLSDDTTQAQVEGLTGLLPFDIRLKRFALADPEGTWLSIDDARLSWSFPALFLLRLQVNEISAARITVDHLPEPGEPEEEEEDDDQEPFKIPTALPELPGFLPAILLEKLALTEIRLGEPVLGEALSLSVFGRVRSINDRSAVEANLDVTRLDRDTLQARLKATAGLYPLALNLSLTAEENGGLVARLAGRPEMTDVRLNLHGEGPLNDWQGGLKADVKSIAKLDSTLRFGITEQSFLGFTGALYPDKGLLPAETLAALGERTDIDVQVKASDSEHVTVYPMTVNNQLLDLQSRIGLNLADQSVAAELDALVDRLNRLSALTGKPLDGSARLNVAVDGPLQQPGVQVRLDSEQLTVDQFFVDQIRVLVNVAILKPLTEGFDGRVTGEGQLQGMMQGQTPLPEQGLDWTLDARVPARGAIELEGFHVLGQYSHLDVAGQIDPVKLQGEGTLELAVEQLSALAPESGVQGEAALNADFNMTQAAEQIVVNLDGGLDRLSGLPPGIDELLGRTMTVSLAADVQPKGVSQVSDLKIQAKGLDLGGQLHANMATKALAGQLRLSIPRLDLLQSAVGQPLAGNFKLDTDISGSTDAPAVTLKAVVKKLVYTDLRFDAVTLDATGHDLIAKPNGAVDLVLKQPKQAIKGAMRYQMDGDQLALSAIRLTAPATNLEGQFDIDLKKTLINGQLKGHVRDLSRLQEWLPLTVSGAVNLETVLRHRGGRQSARLTANASNIDGEFGQVAGVQVNADLNDVLGKNPAIKAHADVSRFKRADTRIDSAKLSANGRLSDLEVEADVKGHQLKEFALRTEARLGQKPGDIRVALMQLAGHFGGEALRLEQPTRFQMRGNRIRLDPLALGFGDARVTATAEYGPGKLDGKIHVFVPLALVKAFDGPDLSGELRTDLALAGSPAAPKADVILDLDAFHLNDEQYQKIPDSTIAVRASLAQGMLGADVKAENAALLKPIAAQAKVPVYLTLTPFKFDLPKNKPLQAQLRAALELDRIAEMLQLEDQSMAGLFNLAVDVKGSLAKPVVDGDITLRDGAYENGATGTILKDVTLTVGAHQQRVTLEELSARDDGSGSLDANGWLAVDQTKDFPFDMKVKVSDMQLMDSKDLKANVGTDLILDGNLRKALLAGDVVVNSVHFQLPSQAGGPTVPEMDVVEVYPGQSAADAQAKEPGRPPVDLQLKLAIDMPGRIFVRGHGLDTEWEGNLKVTGSATDPKVLGQVKTKRGSLELLSHNWKFKKGVVDFDGASPPIPTLDMEATTSTRDGTETLVYITGPATDPKLKLDSNPSLPQSEILSHLLFGEDSNKISPLQAVQLADAVSVLAGGGSFNAFSGVRDTLGVDTLSVGGDSFSTSSVKVGKYITDKIYMELEQGLKSQSTNYSVEVELFPEILLDTEFNQDSNGSIGLKWKRDY